MIMGERAYNQIGLPKGNKYSIHPFSGAVFVSGSVTNQLIWSFQKSNQPKTHLVSQPPLTSSPARRGEGFRTCRWLLGGATDLPLEFFCNQLFEGKKHLLTHLFAKKK